jgi:hypothetical protein
MIVRFTTGDHDRKHDTSGRGGIRTLNPDFAGARVSTAARRAVSGSLPGITTNSGVDSWGVEPRFPACKAGVFPLDEPPKKRKPSTEERSVRELNPDRLPTKEACRRNTCGPTGSNRIVPGGVEPPSSGCDPEVVPLDHRTKQRGPGSRTRRLSV